MYGRSSYGSEGSWGGKTGKIFQRAWLFVRRAVALTPTFQRRPTVATPTFVRRPIEHD